MEKTYLYFQPSYVSEFKCDGAKCKAHCCKNWQIFIDKETYEQYSQVKPEAEAEKITSLMKFDSERDAYLVTLDEKNFCPFLDENNLCRLQLKYGEDFLSVTCTSYPRYSLSFGKFFERSLVLTCPVAAEMVLFNEEPMQFEMTAVPEKVHSHDSKISFSLVYSTEDFFERMLEIQVAMISILQERTLSIDQRLIVLGFFVDKLDELTAEKSTLPEENYSDTVVDELTKLVAAYESKSFLAEQVPRMLATVHFDAKECFALIFQLLEKIYGDGTDARSQFILDMFVEVFKIVPDENKQVSAAEIAANYKALADERKKFLARYSTFLENFLVNELFMTCFPWQRDVSIPKRFGVFVAQYKIFELLMFALVQKNFCSKDDLLEFVYWFLVQTDHTREFSKKVLELAFDDIFTSIETLLDQ